MPIRRHRPQAARRRRRRRRGGVESSGEKPRHHSASIDPQTSGTTFKDRSGGAGPRRTLFAAALSLGPQAFPSPPFITPRVSTPATPPPRSAHTTLPPPLRPPPP